MSTPSVTILKNLVLNWKSNQMEEETIATFYRHYDGYPSCHAIDIAKTRSSWHREPSLNNISTFRERAWGWTFSITETGASIFSRRCAWRMPISSSSGRTMCPLRATPYVVTGAYDNFGGKVSIGAEEYLSRINIKVYEGDENGNLVFEGGAAECLAWADGYCGDC